MEVKLGAQLTVQHTSPVLLQRVYRREKLSRHEV